MGQILSLKFRELLGSSKIRTDAKLNTNSIDDCNTSLGKDAIHRVSTNGLCVAFFFQIGTIRALGQFMNRFDIFFSPEDSLFW
ncbi:hypothetical protein NSTCB13_06428 [Nostoc sp. DSM 114160]|jgi:hypothetical protein